MSVQEPDSDSHANKNVVSGSKITAGNNIHIGDVIIHSVQPAIPANASGNGRFRLLKFYAILLFLLVIGLSAIYIIYFRIPDKQEMDEDINSAEKILPSEKAEQINQAASHYSGGTKQVASENSTGQTAPVTEDAVIQPIDAKEADLKFLKGETVGIKGSGSVQPFYMSKYEVTIAQYLKFCKKEGYEFPYSEVDTSKSRYPMHHITWEEAGRYCANVGGKLPTLAQWKQAALEVTGPDSLWSDEEKLIYSWNKENSGGKLHPIGGKPPATGKLVYDIFGNVEEWCADGPNGSLKYIAGGSCNSRLSSIDSNMNNAVWPFNKNGSIGFRVVY